MASSKHISGSEKIPLSLTRDSLLQFITAQRMERGMSVNQLELAAKIPKDTIRDFQRGKSILIRVDKLQKILTVLGYDLTISPTPRRKGE